MSRPAIEAAPPLIVVVLKGYPRVSETFIAQELAALERRGLTLAIASLRQPYDRITHPVHATIRAPVLYLPEYLVDAPRRVLASHLVALGRAPRRYLRCLALWLRDLVRDPTVNRIRRFGQAGVLATEIPPGTRLLHAHFLHTPASVARYTALMSGLPYSVAAHAKDIWTRPAWELREKLTGARFSVSCTAQNRDHLTRLAPGTRVDLVYHGVDHDFFAPPAAFGSTRDGSDPADPVRLLAVGRFQPKKGFTVLLEAVARLQSHVAVTLVGYGPLARELRALAGRLGLDDRIRWTGPLDQPAVRALYRDSDVFVLAPRVVADGDRDGLPNVVVEALSQGLPVVSTRVSAIPEIIEDGTNGRLVPPEDPAALARALEELVRDPVTRRRLGTAGIRRIAEGWNVETGADRLLALFQTVLRSPAEAIAPAAARESPAGAGHRP